MPGNTIKIRSREGGAFDCYLSMPATDGKVPAVVLASAVVGGRVHFTIDPTFGPTQWDSGGFVHVVDLSNGSDLAVTGPSDRALYRRPQVSPAGSEVVVERYPLIIINNTGIGGTIDTTVARDGDLYLVGQP